MFNIIFRNELKKLLNSCQKLEEQVARVLRDVEEILFINKSEAQPRLLSSFYDRKPFTNLLEDQSPDEDDSPADGENVSYQRLAKIFFSKRIQEEAATNKVKNENSFKR